MKINGYIIEAGYIDCKGNVIRYRHAWGKL
jgi:hypothetical protein